MELEKEKLNGWIVTDLGIVRITDNTIWKKKVGATRFNKLRTALAHKESAYKLNTKKESEAIVFLSNNLILIA